MSALLLSISLWLCCRDVSAGAACRYGIDSAEPDADAQHWRTEAVSAPAKHGENPFSGVMADDLVKRPLLNADGIACHLQPRVPAKPSKLQCTHVQPFRSARMTVC